MDHITIPIPDGMDATQKAELADWLSKEVKAALPQRMPMEDDPAWQAEAARGIQRAMQDVEAGRVMDSAEAIKRLDAKIGYQRPA
ncbi:MAG: hypothetical protein AAGC44_05040 [Planctomycetota bacterium]